MGYLLILIGMFSAPADDSSLWNPQVEENVEIAVPFIWTLRFQTGIHAAGNDPETGLPLYESESEDNLLGEWAVEDFLQPRTDTLYPWFLVEFDLEAEFYRQVGLRFTLSTGEIHYEEGEWLTSRRSAKDDGRTESDGRTVSDEFLASGFVREVVLTSHFGPVYLEAGKRMGEVLGGLVYGNYGLGALASLDFRDLDLGPWSLSVAADMVGEDWSDYADPNPLLSMRIEWEYDFFESLVFEAAYFNDRTSLLGGALSSVIVERQILNPIPPRGAPPFNCSPDLEVMAGSDLDPVQCQIWGYVLNPPTTTGDVIYVGFSGNHFFQSLSLRYSFAWQQGAMELTAPNNNEDTFELSGYAGDVNLHYSLTSKLGVSAFGVFLSGQGPPLEESDDGDVILPAFIAPAPYWVWSRMFFTGGLSQGVFSARSTAAGINAHGVAAAGIAFDWADSWYEVSGRVLWLEAMAALKGQLVDGEPTHYGLETNLESRFLIWDGAWFDLFANAELDFFIPGNFFPEDDVAYRAIGLLDVVLRD